jgi:Effector Associated Constant Component 1
VSVADTDRAGLESLDEWLHQEPVLAGRITALVSEPRAGELGALSQALVVAVGSGGVLSVLAASLRAWLSLPRRSDIRVEVHGPDGRSVVLDAHRINGKDLEGLIRQVLPSGSVEE